MKYKLPPDRNGLREALEILEKKLNHYKLDQKVITKNIAAPVTLREVICIDEKPIFDISVPNIPNVAQITEASIMKKEALFFTVFFTPLLH